MGQHLKAQCCGVIILFLFAGISAATLNEHHEETNSTITCKIVKEGELDCDGEIYDLYEDEHAKGATAILYGVISVCLILTAGLMSGLTIGLMALDQMNLQILQHSGDETQKKYAARILPVVKRHHHMLVTLLLCNAGAMEALPLFLDRLMSPVVAVLLSVTAVLFFGEIIPQALCVRFGLAIGAYTAWLVQLLMFVTFPITWPISKILDYLLGTEHGTHYKRSELKELVTMHANINHGPLSLDEITVIRGALDMRTKTVRDCMTPLENVFMVDINDRFDEHLIKRFMADGHSRMPVFSENRQNLVGLLLVKSLVGISAEHAVPIRQIGLRPLPAVTSDKGLYEMLNEFQTGKSHMAAVSDSQTGDILGVITLEDVIEELIQEEIIDETDTMDFEEKMAKVFKQVRRPRHSKSSENLRDMDKSPLLTRSGNH